ncbi:MAG: GNAT family N-acetyltransferase [Cyanobacteria bacterium CRU_2_1]|nr:GNAT family N-acetyltransferase [Cyanobacteria bacterium RU_5_0]NJR59019.1 GNAT family N-acetyltransferase [Cyanobacteria bacterium CRU_2_1]
MNIFLETDRLILRRLTESDSDHLFELDSDPDVAKFATRDGQPTPYDMIQEMVLPKMLKCYEMYESYGFWVAIEKSSNQFIGWFHLRPGLESPAFDDPCEVELGYRLKKLAWGKGYATEGSRALVRKGFCELNTQRITATALVANTASIRVMQKTGLRFERYFTETRCTYGDQPAVKYSLDTVEFNLDEY